MRDVEIELVIYESVHGNYYIEIHLARQTIVLSPCYATLKEAQAAMKKVKLKRVKKVLKFRDI